MELNNKTHLLFTFSSVECKELKKGESSKTVFGYAFLALIDKQNKLIDTSITFDIPVAKELASIDFCSHPSPPAHTRAHAHTHTPSHLSPSFTLSHPLTSLCLSYFLTYSR